MKRFIVRDYLGHLFFIDREQKYIALYKPNLYGQIHNLNRPIRKSVTDRTINGLIKRTQTLKYRSAERSSDGYIFTYLMDSEQQSQCKFEPSISFDKLVLETDNYA